MLSNDLTENTRILFHRNVLERAQLALPFLDFDPDPYMVITNDGRFLYAAGESSSKLAAYRVNAKTGGLERFATYAVGKRPWWVLAISLPSK